MIKLYRLNEWHPGANDIKDSISYFIDRAQELDIKLDDLIEAIRLLANYRNTGETREVTSEEHRAIKHMENAIETMIDDGWPEDWIYQELEKLIN
jgi:DNA-binding transcriptional regulator YhcF (GntR family)